MFNSKTVFIVGAGASADLKLPLGTDLRDRIAALLSKVKHDEFGAWSAPPWLSQAIRAKAHADEEDDRRAIKNYFTAARHIAENMPLVRSIDEFVDQHAGDRHIEFVAKLAICWEVIDAERRSILLSGEENRRRLNYGALREQDAWLLELWYLLREGARGAQARTIFENVTFIVFNYDRCLEVFLAQALESMFRLTSAEAFEIIHDVPIIHPYGALGGLGSTGRTEFGTPERLDLGLVAQGIQTFGESERDAGKMRDIRSALDEAVNVVFLGFAFHDQNLDFFDSETDGEYPRVYATAFGLPSEHQEDIRRSLIRRWGRPRSPARDFLPIFHRDKGASLLRTYGPTLRR